MTNELPAILDNFCRLVQSRLGILSGDGQTGKGTVDFSATLQKQTARIPLLARLSGNEAGIFMLALLPHILPDFFERAVLKAFPQGGDLPLLGGVKGTNQRGMLPTGETAQAVLAGTDIKKRLAIQALLQPDAMLSREGLLFVEAVREGEPPMSGRLIIPQAISDQILFDREAPPRFGPEFPAKQITTAMNWDDAVLPPSTRRQVSDIGAWLTHHSKIAADPNLSRKVKPGYRVLFYGPPGTGKTLTAALMGKEHRKDIYRIDLSQIVSKYIGETEKNLETVFRRAERKDWILFFDEADALFGKRTGVQSAHDKYANQEVSYLLQRVEDYNGLLILASNFRNNIDEAFLRRFHAIIHFPLPTAQERHQLWLKSLPAGLPLDGGVDLKGLAAQYELTGAGILAAVHFAALRSYEQGAPTLTESSLVEGIRKEYLKEERSL